MTEVSDVVDMVVVGVMQVLPYLALLGLVQIGWWLRGRFERRRSI